MSTGEPIQAPGRDEAVLDRAEAPRHRGSRRGSRRSRSNSARTSAPCRPAASSASPWWRSELADVLEKFEGDALPDTRGLERYLEGLG